MFRVPITISFRRFDVIVTRVSPKIGGRGQPGTGTNASKGGDLNGRRADANAVPAETDNKVRH